MNIQEMGCERNKYTSKFQIIFHTLVKLCVRKNTIQLKVENIENLFYFRGFFPTLSSSLEYSFFTWNLSTFRPYLAVFSH
jgi:hypothetical protein